jgi:toxin ParE1/3/4
VSRRRKVVIRPAANRDLDEQARYIANASGLDRGLRFYESAAETFRILVIHPHLGRATRLSNPFLGGTRMFPLKNFDHHIVFYRPVQRGVEIIRVIHGSRDLDTLMDS